ncbi:hypothetical protein [Microcystis aeruginosa]|uniref:Uncharacterized protein n=1 Tax=Microcystis aeruginosa PCC 9808 TaxID=1160284 RepID=I4I0I7_MICAE|nr:hypothetical protein [Microcystis aeruginosa]CCI27811.1 conserved hypothetical protein [Microcystis aeruginosa PCC 9808]
MQLIEAICIESPREVTTKYGQRLVIDAIDRTTGEKITLWRPATDDYSRRYVIKNSPLTVGVDSKGKYSLIEDPALVSLGQPLPESPVPVKPVSRYLASNNPPIPNYSQNSEKPNDSDQSLLKPSQKREIAQYIQDMAKLYGFCLTQAESLGVEGEDKRAIATTLFISAQKKFAL